MIPKRYIGDGVYVDVEDSMLKLTTEDGISVTNTIFLEPYVYDALVRFYSDACEFARAMKKIRDEADRPEEDTSW